jgi:hypothetical protein
VGDDTLRIVESEGPSPSSGTIRTGAGKVVPRVGRKWRSVRTSSKHPQVLRPVFPRFRLSFRGHIAPALSGFRTENPKTRPRRVLRLEVRRGLEDTLRRRTVPKPFPFPLPLRSKRPSHEASAAFAALGLVLWLVSTSHPHKTSPLFRTFWRLFLKNRLLFRSFLSLPFVWISQSPFDRHLVFSTLESKKV